MNTKRKQISNRNKVDIFGQTQSAASVPPLALPPRLCSLTLLRRNQQQNPQSHRKQEASCMAIEKQVAQALLPAHQVATSTALRARKPQNAVSQNQSGLGGKLHGN
jgi:hypothetical protein